MGTLILFAVFIGWGAMVALADIFGPGAEGWARLVAAGLLVLHPVHEQRKGFRYGFNAAVKGYSPSKWASVVNLPPSVVKWREHPLSHHMNLFQATLLATVFPALALFGPWWALGGIVSFYLLDSIWTHGIQKIPGLSSATIALVAVFVAGVLARPELAMPPEAAAGWERAAFVGSFLVGALIIAFPWWNGYRSVRNV